MVRRCFVMGAVHANKANHVMRELGFEPNTMLGRERGLKDQNSSRLTDC